MKCSYCNKNKNISNFRRNRKACKKCEYQSRKEYLKKYQEDNKQKLNQYNNIYQKSKNWYYIPSRATLDAGHLPRERKPKIIIDKDKVRTLSEKDIHLIIKFDFLI